MQNRRRPERAPRRLVANDLADLRRLQTLAAQSVRAATPIVSPPAGTRPRPPHTAGSGGRIQNARAPQPGTPCQAGGRPRKAAPGGDTAPLEAIAPATPTTPAKPARAAQQAMAQAQQDAWANQVLSRDDRDLFRRVVQSVTPLPESDTLLLPPVPCATTGQLRQRRLHAMGTPNPAGKPARKPGPSRPRRNTARAAISDHYAPAELADDDRSYLRRGHGTDVLAGLRKGRWPVEASVDLHGCTLEQARERLERFLDSCREHTIRSVCIVHGKGYGSANGQSVLKQTVRSWLGQLPFVQAWVEAPDHMGGAGAVIALLEKSA